ncbi:MAG: corrinoid protein-associated methyltransferase CpaM [Pseudomonadota bacterium]
MSSYVYMKILETQPRRYDRGIAWLSLGRAQKAKRRLVEDNVEKGCRVLEIGAGTGTMAVLAAGRGARVTGFDVSGPMLQVARKKVRDAGLEESIELLEMGVSGMDRFDDESFDLVMSTLVFSELSHDEQAYALRHARRVLKPGGRLAVADEARPRGLARRVLHGALRIPLVAITFALTQTSTRAVEGLEDAIRAAGFEIVKAQRSAFDSFLYVVAQKEGRP